MGLGVVLIRLNCGLELGSCFREPLLAQICRAQIVVGGIEVRRNIERLDVVGDCLVDVAALLGLHTLLVFLDGLLRKTAIVLGGIDEVGIAATDTASWVLL